MTIGTFKARAKEWGLGMSTSGKEQIAILFELTAGEQAGHTYTWFGYFTEGAVDRTLDSLRYCGWQGDNIAELDGLDANEVDIVLDEEEYEGKMRTKVKWVNRPARLALKEQMNAAQMASFAARLRGKAVAHKQKFGNQAPAPSRSAPTSRRSSSDAAPWDDNAPPPEDGDSIPF